MNKTSLNIAINEDRRDPMVDLLVKKYAKDWTPEQNGGRTPLAVEILEEIADQMHTALTALAWIKTELYGKVVEDQPAALDHIWSASASLRNLTHDLEAAAQLVRDTCNCDTAAIDSGPQEKNVA